MEMIPKEHEITDVGYLMSACWMMPAILIEKIGLLDENIFYAPEDVEYCLRAWKRGYRVCYDQDALIVHAWQRLSRKNYLAGITGNILKGCCIYFGSITAILIDQTM